MTSFQTRPSPAAPLAVAMPTLNQIQWLPEAVASVLEQGSPGTELWVQDGGSSDGTPALLHALASRHPGLRWVSEPDTGPAQALNRVFSRMLARSHAPVFGWLNSDDLYAPGAAERALTWLQHQPEAVMVYGEAEHIDAQGRNLGRYPTRPPEQPVDDWRDGCHICQPSVFMRRELLQQLLPLDEALRTAFDYELWLRVLTRYAGRVGFVPEVQAMSRVHEATITGTQRLAVAMEALQIIHRHLGQAPPHWLLTYADEWLATLPGSCPPGERPQAHLQHCVERAAAWLEPGAAAALGQRFADHRALQLATDELCAPVHADGWTAARQPLHCRPLRSGWRTLRLWGRHASPGALRLHWASPQGSQLLLTAPAPGPISVEFQLQVQAQVLQTWWLQRDDGGFVPSRDTPPSDDRRALGFVLEGMVLS